MQISVTVMFEAEEPVPDLEIQDLANEVLAVFNGDVSKDICRVAVSRPPLTASVGAEPTFPPPE